MLSCQKEKERRGDAGIGAVVHLISLIETCLVHLLTHSLTHQCAVLALSHNTHTNTSPYFSTGRCAVFLSLFFLLVNQLSNDGDINIF